MTSNFCTVDSLQNLSIHYISFNLIKFSQKQYGQLLYLPNRAQNKILRKTLSVCSVMDKLGRPLYQQIFRNLINKHTFELNLINVVQIDASIIKSLQKCQNLQELTLDGLNDLSLVKDIMNIFRELKHMRSITITSSTIIQPNLVGVIVECMQKLEAVDFRGCSTFNDTCAHLMIGKLDKLRRLALSRTGIGFVGVQNLIEGREALLELILNGCPNLQSEHTAVAHLIATRLPQLRFLSVDVLPFGEFYNRCDCQSHRHSDRGDIFNSTCKCNRPLQQLTYIIPF